MIFDIVGIIGTFAYLIACSIRRDPPALYAVMVLATFWSTMVFITIKVLYREMRRADNAETANKGYDGTKESWEVIFQPVNPVSRMPVYGVNWSQYAPTYFALGINNYRLYLRPLSGMTKMQTLHLRILDQQPKRKMLWPILCYTAQKVPSAFHLLLIKRRLSRDNVERFCRYLPTGGNKLQKATTTKPVFEITLLEQTAIKLEPVSNNSRAITNEWRVTSSTPRELDTGRLLELDLDINVSGDAHWKGELEVRSEKSPSQSPTDKTIDDRPTYRRISVSEKKEWN